jgi:phage tail-like protein
MAAKYPLSTFHYSVNWGGTRIGFTEVTGLTMENDVIEYREGSSSTYNKIKMPGLQKFGTITLKRGMFQSDNDFYNWFSTINTNKFERRDITISLLDEMLLPIVVWTVENAWPFKVVYPDLKATASEVAIEILELTHEGLTIQNN